MVYDYGMDSTASRHEFEFLGSAKDEEFIEQMNASQVLKRSFPFCL
jgi:hypothetical protein